MPAAKASAPQDGRNPMGFGFIIGTQVFGALMACGGLYFGVNERLAGYGVPNDSETTCLALVGSVVLCNGFLQAMVNKARKDYDVKWPQLMLPKGDKNAVAYNSVQRAHANYCEGAFVMVPVCLVAASQAPAFMLLLTQVWCWGKFGMSYMYAYSADTEARFAMAWSYMPYFASQGLVWLALLKKFGVSLPF